MTSLETMKQVYLLAQAHCGLKVGDYVKVTRKAEDYEAGWNSGWFDCQTKHVGKIGIINNKTIWGIAIKFSKEVESEAYVFPYFVLEKVEKPEHQFKPFDKVLVRDNITDFWRPDIFSFYVINRNLLDDPDRPFQCISDSWPLCIPYEGNELLLGTTDMPEGNGDE